MQSMNIFAGNYQILSRLPFLTGIDFPEPFVSICGTIGDIVDGAVRRSLALKLC